jgi:branched-chain amino acid transport system substrate-binding protein
MSYRTNPDFCFLTHVIHIVRRIGRRAPIAACYNWPGRWNSRYTDDPRTYRPTLAILLLLIGCNASAAEPIKIAVIDPLSSSFATVGESQVREAQLASEGINARGGVLGGRKFEIVDFDGKGSPQESQLALKRAIDMGIRIVNQSAGSSVAAALIEAINKHNARNPDQTVLYLNTGAIDPALTNDKCSFWHFRFDADADIKMAALTDSIAGNSAVKRVYLINQDYSFGQAVSRSAKALLAKKRPDIEIVGDDLHPLGMIKDFAPYIAKIKAANADAVITGNWGNDLALMIKAAREVKYSPSFYTMYASVEGNPSALGDAGLGQVNEIAVWFPNIDGGGAGRHYLEFRSRFKDSKTDITSNSHRVAFEMLAKAMDKVQSTDSAKIARAMEGMNVVDDAGEVTMRADNHQLLQPLFAAVYSKVDGKDVKYDAEHTGNGFKVVRRIEAKDTAFPTTCKMQRP